MGSPALVGLGTIGAVPRNPKIDQRRYAPPVQHPAHGNGPLRA
jgi:hypothetical protein